MSDPNQEPDQDGGLSEEEVEELLTNIQEMSEGGATRTQIRKALTEAGAEEEAATELINAALGKPGSARARSRRMAAADAREEGSSGGGASSWLIWIGLLALVNLLSWLFDWPFWIY